MGERTTGVTREASQRSPPEETTFGDGYTKAGGDAKEETAEEERKAREAEKEAEKNEILELRQVALRKEKEAYEAMYGHSE